MIVEKDMWADLEDGLGANGEDLRAGVDEPEQVPAVYYERCAKCNGSGRYWGPSRLGQACFACKGEGKFARRSSPEARARAKANKVARHQRSVASWAEAHPEAMAWIQAKQGKFRFASAMAEAVAKYGHLTENQLATVERLRLADVERDAQRAQERVAQVAAAPAISVAPLEQAFAKALSTGSKRIVLRLASYRFSYAKAESKNPGAIYVKQRSDGEDAYLGKIQDGKFVRAFGACSPEMESEIVALCNDPEAAAVAYGRRLGRCAICGAELSNKASIERGIGPICAEKFGW